MSAFITGIPVHRATVHIKTLHRQQRRHRPQAKLPKNVRTDPLPNPLPLLPPATPEHKPQLLLSLALPLIPFLPIQQLQPFQASFHDSLAAFLTGPHFPIASGFFLSALIQSLTGFGFAIISVASLTNLPWIANSTLLQSVQPVAATLGAATTFALLLPEINLVKWRSLTPLLVSTTLLTPLGLYFSEFESQTLLRGLGALISAYVIYTTSGVKLPKILATNFGAYVLGGIAGVFGGMFDITGPALVIYGDAKGWMDDFRRNLLAVLSLNSAVVVTGDFFSGRLQDFYYLDFVKSAAPAAVMGIVMGRLLSKSMRPEGFRRLVLATCFVVGIKMMLF